VAKAWIFLNSGDRFLRYAARVAIESQPVAEWKARALAERQPTAALTALLALARSSPREAQPELLAALERFPLDKLPEEQKFEKLRVLQLTCIRQGRPGAEAGRKLIVELNRLFPGPDELLNRELVQQLIYLQAPDVVAKSLKQMADAKTQQ